MNGLKANIYKEEEEERKKENQILTRVLNLKIYKRVDQK
jgi:hypothetical protein